MGIVETTFQASYTEGLYQESYVISHLRYSFHLLYVFYFNLCVRVCMHAQMC